jgi:hypothetical protein
MVAALYYVELAVLWYVQLKLRTELSKHSTSCIIGVCRSCALMSIALNYAKAVH